MAISLKYISALQSAIQSAEGCDCKHVESVPIRDAFQDKIAWEGVVEVFDLVNHPKAKRCYAWGHATKATGKEIRLVIVLGVKPVDSPHKAVQVSLLNDTRRSH